MLSHDPPYRSSAPVVAGHLLFATLAAFPLVCFTLALVTDIAYWRTSNLMWLEFSAWLLLAGIVFAGLAAAVGTLRFFLDADRRDDGADWVQVAGTVVVLVLAFLNNLVHAADGWTAVVPWGLVLSALTVLVLFATAGFAASRVSLTRSGGRRYV